MPTQYQLKDTTCAYDQLKQNFSSNILERLGPYLAKKDDIIEFGPGAGQFAQECIRRGYKYVGVESSGPFQSELKKHGIEVIDANVLDIPLPDHCADLVYASMVLEHMSTPMEAVGMVQEAARLVRPGGIVCLMFPNAYTCGRIFWEMDYTHGYYTTPRRVTQMCDHLGLNVIVNERVVGWFWTRTTPLLHILLLISNLVTSIVNASVVISSARVVGLEGILWKIRKTFFESSIIIARKPSGQPG